jgi:T5SS/PEP-CTERM-associated repeat protein
MNKALLVATALAGLLFAAGPAAAAIGVGGGCTPIPGQECSGDVEASGGGTGTTTVGNSSGGTLTITGAYTTGTLIAGSVDGVTGMVTVGTTGTLNDDAIIGDAGTGTFTNNNTHNVTGNLILGNQSTGIGSYTITGSSAVTNVNFAGTAGSSPPETPNGALIVGNAGTGSFTQETFVGSDATPAVNVAGDVALGLQSSSTGTYTLNDGTLTVGGVMIVGAASTNANLFTQKGGTVTLTGSANGNSLYAPVSPGAVPPTFAGTLFIGGESIFDNGTGTYALTGGNLNAPTIEVGFSGTGTVNQSGGAVTAGYIDLGGCGGCNGGNAAGFYNLSGNGTINASAETVGDVGHGQFVQGADGLGTTVNTVNGTLAIGNSATATPNVANSGNYDRSGTYTLDSGTLNTQYTYVGNVGTGAFIQNGGTHAITDTLVIGAQNSQPLSGPAGSGTPSNPVFGGPAPGTYTMTNGILTANGDQSVGNDTSGAGIIVDDAGNGTFNQIGGLVTSGVGGTQRGDLVISAQAGSTGNYNLGDSTNGAPTLQVYGDATIGRDAAGGVTVPDGLGDGGTVTVPLASANGTLTIAGNGTAMSVNQYTGFDSRNGGNMLVGLSGTGTVTQTDSSTLYTDHNLVLGANAGSSGTYTLNATSTTANSGYNLFVGSDLNIGGMTSLTDSYNFNFQTTVNGGTGTFNLQSGAVATAGAVNVGNNDGTGTLNISGGTLAAGNGMNIGVNDFTINNDTGNVDRSGATGGGSGSVTQTGGAVTVGGPTSSKTLNLGITANASDPTTGTYTITGASTLDVYGNADIGVSTGATGTMTIGSGLDSPTVNIHSTGAGDGNLTVADTGTGNLTVKSGALSIDGGLSIGVNGVGTVIQSGGTVTASIVDMTTPVGSGSASYTISGGTLHSTGDLNVGGAGAGPVSFSQSGDSTTVNVDGTLRVGNFYNTGSYTLSGGTLNVGGDSLIGNDSLMGTMTQSGGSHLVNGTLTLGDGTGSSGLYTLSGGILTTGITGGSSIGDVVIGRSGTGELDNSGGTQTSESANGLTLGFFGGSQGTYKLTGTGSLSVAGNENVGVFGMGTFLQGDGSGTTSNTVGGSLYISSGFGGPASSYTLTDGTLTVTGSEVVGFAAQGSFTQSGGTNNANGGLTVGALSNAPTDPTQFGNGTYTLGGNGALNVSGGDVVLGSGTGTSGTFNYNTVSGDVGSLSFTGSGQNLVVGDAGTGIFNEGSASNTADLNLQTSGTTLDIGRSVGGTGTFNLAAGSTLEDDVIVGDAGTGTFNNAGGGHSVSGNLILGNQSTGNGTYNLTAGGTTSVSDFTFVGAAGTGAFLNDASTHNTQNLVIGQQGTSSGNLYTLQHGGSLNVGTTGSPGFMDVAEHGSGTFTQTSGTTTIIGDIDLGRCGGIGCNGVGDTDTGVGNGTVNLLGGSMSVSSFAVVGDSGTGTFTQSGAATMTVGGTLTVGRGESNGGGPITGTGTYTLGGSGSLSVGGDLVLGSLTGNTGTFNYNTASGDAATLSFTGPGQNLVVGDAGKGTFYEGATGNTTDLNLQTSGTALDIGRSAGGNGTFNLAAGSSLEDDMIVGDAGTGTFNNNAGSNTVGTTSVPANLILGNQSTGIGTYNNNGGSNTVNGNLVVGNAGTGTYNLGNGVSGATLNVNGSGLSGGNVYVGQSGTGTIVASDGSTAIIQGVLTLGGASPGDLGTGTLTVTGAGTSWTNQQQAQVGGAGTGTLNVLAGGYFESDPATSPSGTSGVIGVLGPHDGLGDPAANGFATVDGAGSEWNNKGALVVGEFGNGTLTISNGGLVVDNAGTNGAASVGLKLGSTGSVTITGATSTWTNNGNLNVGDGGTGTVTQGSLTDNTVSGGAVTVTGNLNIGNVTDGGTGIYNINGPSGVAGATTLAVSNDVFVGGGGLGSTVNQLGGAVTIGTATTSSANTTGIGNLNLGYNAGDVGSYSMSGGTLTINGNASFFNAAMEIGVSGTGTFTQTGGAINTYGANGFAIGDCTGCGGSGSYAISGGSLTVNPNATAGAGSGNGFVGAHELGTMTQSGNATVSIAANLFVGYDNAASTGSFYTLGGTGSLTIGAAGTGDLNIGTQNGASGTFNYNIASGDKAALTFAGTSQNLVVGDAATGVFNEGSSSNTTDLNLQTSGTTLDIGRSVGGNGTFNLAAGSSLEDDMIVGDAGTGTFNNNAGSNAVSGNLVLGNQATSNGTYNLTAGGTLTVSGGAEIGSAGIGVYAQTGGTATITGTMTINNNANSSASISGGLLTASAIVNNSTLTLNGGTVDAPITNNATTQTNSGNTMTVNGAAINNGTWTVSSGSTMNQSGGFTNNGTVNVSNSTAHWTGTFTNNGAYNSDPSANYFTDLTVGANGYLTGGAGDLFNVSGNFHNTSTQSTLWNTTGSTLEYSGTTGTSHTMDLVGADVGPNASGFTNNYAWGLLDLDAGNSLSLDGTVGTNALYAAALEGLDISGDDITNIVGNGLNIYYNPADDAGLDDLTYALANGGFLCPIGASTCTVSTSPPPPGVPEPASLLLLGGGLAGLAFVRRRVARSQGQAPTR